MGMSVTISVATERDAEQIFRLQYLCFQSEAALYGNYRIDPLVQSLDSVREEVGADCVYVARLGELYKRLPPLWGEDPEPEGFEWVDIADRANSIFS